MAEVAFHHISKRFGQVVAVNDLSLTVNDGEFLVLVGPSGCGKTTALRIVAGLEEPSDGDLFIGGRRVNDVAPADRDIAMVFQNYALYPTMSVYDNIAFGLRNRKVPKQEIDQLVTSVASMLDIGSLLKRRPKELSGGQRQRVALARAIVRKPQAFLMDEPLSNLDAKLRVQTRSELIKLHQRLGTTTVYVTHDQTEAMTMGTRIAVMKDGLLQQLDTPQRLYDEPANQFVAGFIGSPAMNFLTGRIVERGAGFGFAVDGQTLALDPKHEQALRSRLGQTVVLGVRPEHISPAAEGDAQSLKAEIEVVEPLGSDAFVSVRAGGHPVVGRFEPHFRGAPGDPLWVHVNVETAHFFDPETQAAIR